MIRRTLLATIKKLGAGNLARALGVSPSTVRRWRSGATPKPDSLARVESLLGEASPLAPSAILKLPAVTLADYAGVTEKTVKKWQKAGAMPKRYRERARTRSLVEARIGEPVKVPSGKRERRQYIGRRTRGIENRLTWEEPVHLGPVSLGQVVEFLRSAELSKAPGESWLQVIIKAKCDSDMADSLIANHYGTVMVSQPPELVYRDHVFAGTVKTGRNARNNAAEEIKGVLEEAMPYNFMLESVSLYHRRPR